MMLRNMKKVLILGAGLVSAPVVAHLTTNYEVTLVDKSGESIKDTIRKVEQVKEEHVKNLTTGSGDGETFIIDDQERTVKDLIRENDVIISLLPSTMHADIAKMCIKEKRHLVTASYTSLEMQELDEEAKKAGITLINECGLDPGIDHMSAMKLINKLKKEGKEIISFHSYCGGLPATPHTNPFSYQFSWSPLGVLRAGKSSAQFRKDGETVQIRSGELFKNTFNITIGPTTYEAYYNRNSIPYMEKYSLTTIPTFVRGTLRYPGWGKVMQALNDLHFFEEMKQSLGGVSYRKLLQYLIGEAKEFETAKEARMAASKYLDKEYDDPVMEKLAWLGIFTKEKIPEGVKTPLTALNRLMKKKMSYEEGQRDKIVMHHIIGTEDEDITSTLEFYGEPDGFSAMATTVGLPVAYAAELILTGELRERGVIIPTIPEIYEPILKKLSEEVIRFKN